MQLPSDVMTIFPLHLLVLRLKCRSPEVLLKILVMTAVIFAYLVVFRALRCHPA